ncbi:MAG: type II secretion system protein [Minisyncoccota bacterium]
MRSKGFTLIELLVVVAIIGILSAIVITYLSDARDKGRNIKIRSQLSGVRTSAEAYLSSSGRYNGNAGNISGNCLEAGSMFTSSVGKMSEFLSLSNYPFGTDLSCYSTNNAYAVSASLVTPESGYTHWCIDSSGDSKGRSGAINSTNC